MSSSSGTHTQTLRPSASLSSVHGVGSSGVGKEQRKERWKASVTSFHQQQQPSPLSADDSNSYLTAAAKAGVKRAQRRSYFDSYPERNSPRTRGDKPTLPAEEKDEQSDTAGRASTIRGSISASVSLPSAARKGKGRDESGISAAEPSYAFPPMRSDRRSASGQSERKSKLQQRTSLAPHLYASRDDVPTLRFSYSSTQTQVETPPQTPIESSTSATSLDSIRVVVAAPIAGVEAMDALVDGMDGSDDDDLFKRLTLSASSSKLVKSSTSVINHHPLYAPPLPEPPPGIKLGGALPRNGPISRNQKHESSSENDGEDDRDDTDTPDDLNFRERTALGGSATRPPKRRHGGSRSSSISYAPRSTVDRRPGSSSTYEHDLMVTTHVNPTIDDIIRRHTASSKPKAIVPSIDEIISKNTTGLRNTPSPRPPQSRPTTGNASSANGHTKDPSESEPEPLSPAEEAELIARSSIDSVAAEVQQTLRAQEAIAIPLPTPSAAPALQQRLSSLPSHHDRMSQRIEEQSRRSTTYSSKNSRNGASSIRSGTNSTSAGGPPPSPFPSPDLEFGASFTSLQNSLSQKGTQKEAIAKYLRSTRITTLLKLTRRPHASPEQPLTVSLSDLGSPTGFPLVVFLGLGCVRYVMGLYDEMAECLGLRLITIDRWGLGRTDTPSPSASRGVPEWSTVVHEVLEHLNIDKCSIMAHSAGAPYALSFANKYPERIMGDICLLAPWVGGGSGGGYRWLKYVPNGLLKTAQAAEWKIQAWMIGKPPKITYEGIGYNAMAPISSTAYNIDSHGRFVRTQSEHEDDEHEETGNYSVHSPTSNEGTTINFRLAGRRTFSSNGSTHTFSDYDDLEDFGGRFDSRSTLEPRRRVDSGVASLDSHKTSSQMGHLQSPVRMTKKKTSRGFLRIWKGIPTSHNTPPPMPSIESRFQQQQPKQNGSGKKLRTLKSLGSLRSKGSPANGNSTSRTSKASEKSPVLPEHNFDVTLRLDDLRLTNSRSSNLDLDSKTTRPRGSTYSADTPNSSPTPTAPNGFPNGKHNRANGRRSVSFTTATASYTVISTPPPSSYNGIRPGRSSTKKSGESYQVTLGNALIAASHAESSKGTHTDLLQILNHEQKPWGFSYQRYPHCVRVWYGDKDERIAENAVRWMEQNMGPERCSVKVVKGADHGLMYKTNVVVDVLEQARGFWQDGASALTDIFLQHR